MLKRSHAFGLFWILAALAAGSLYFYWRVDVDLIGLVETRVHKVGAREGGVVREVLADVGSLVQAGQIMARLSCEDLDADERQLKEELATLQMLVEADRERVRLELQRLNQQAAGRHADLAERRAELRSRRAEIVAIDTEIQRLLEAERAGLGHSRDLADFVIRKRALAEYLQGYQHDLDADDTILAVEPPDVEQVVTSMAAGRVQRIEEIRREIVSLSERRKLREVVAPAEGYVVAVVARPGDTVPAFDPVFDVQEAVARYVDVYLPETAVEPAQLDQKVEVLPKRPDARPTTGVVSFIYPGYLPIPERLMYRNQISWALMLRVDLAVPNDLRPGESVRVRLVSETRVLPAESVARAAEGGSVVVAPPPRPVEVPEALAARTYLEPSGLAWLPDASRFLVVSDDTGRKGGTPSHLPWLFAMDSEGRFDPEPLPVEGLDQVNDLEAITPGPDGSFYALTSQSVNKKGKRPRDRQLLLKLRLERGRLTVAGRVALWPLLAALPAEQVSALGLDPSAPEATRPLNVEAAAWRDGSLLLGLKQPVAATGALLWKLDRVDDLLAAGSLAPGQVSLLATIDLGLVAGRRAAFSDLAFDARGRLFALSTVPQAPDAEQEGALLLLEPVAGGYRARALERFPGLKPEGLAIRDATATVVFDAGDKAPGLFARRELPR